MTVNHERPLPRVGTRARSAERRRQTPREVVEPAPLRSAKGAGVILPRSDAEHALFLRLEADPGVASWARFDPGPFLTRDQALALISTSMAYIVHDTGNYVLAVHEAPLRGKVAGRGMSSLEGQLAASSVWLLRVPAVDLYAQPRWRNAKTIADCRFEPVSASDRLRIVDEVDRQGALEISDCAALLPRRSKPEAAVFALVCDGTLSVDLDQPLTPHSLVVSRHFAGVSGNRLAPGLPLA